MLLKRLYDTPAGWVRQVNTRSKETGQLVDSSKPEGACLNPPPFKGIAIGHTGIDAEQNFSERLVRGAVKEGWMTLSKGKLVLHSMTDDLSYAIKRGPGRFCSHCGCELDTDKDAQAHVASVHAGAKSPDAQNPAGYEKVDGYECVLAADQHKKYRSDGSPVHKFHRGAQAQKGA
jgi:hypothetical protein